MKTKKIFWLSAFSFIFYNLSINISAISQTRYVKIGDGNLILLDARVTHLMSPNTKNARFIAEITRKEFLDFCNKSLGGDVRKKCIEEYKKYPITTKYYGSANCEKRILTTVWGETRIVKKVHKLGESIWIDTSGKVIFNSGTAQTSAAESQIRLLCPSLFK